METSENDGRQFALEVARNAVHRNCTNVTVVDLRDISPATNYYVIATSTSTRQARTVADETNDIAKTYDFKRFGKAGYEQGRWILLDYVDVVVHIFDEEYRGYYDLELLWGDAKRLDIA